MSEHTEFALLLAERDKWKKLYEKGCLRYQRLQKDLERERSTIVDLRRVLNEKGINADYIINLERLAGLRKDES